MNPSVRPLLSLAGYVVLLPLAWIQQWYPGDLAWGLWISGFVMVSIWLFVMSVLLVFETRFDPLRTGGLLVGMAAFAGGLVWLYDFYGEIINLAFPLLPDLEREALGESAWSPARDFPFWPCVLAAMKKFPVVIALSLLPLLTGLRRDRWDADKFRHSPEFSGPSFARLHATVLALVGLQVAFQAESSPNTFWLSAAILTINFFPWELLDKRKFAELRSLRSHG